MFDLITCAFIFLSLSLCAWLTQSSPSTLPPGPRPIPIVGNIRDFTLKELWLTAQKWSQKYGDVCHLHVLGWGIIFLSTPEAAFELLDKRGAIYSDKPKLQMMGHLCGCENMVPLSNYGEKFKRQRRHIQQTLGPRSIPAYYPIIQSQTQKFLHDLIYEPSEYLANIRKYAGGLTLSVVYGYRATSAKDKFLVIAEECLAILANEIAAGSGIWPVDLFPVLNYLPTWMPGAGFKRKAAVWKTKIGEFIDQPFEYAKASARDGTILPSFCSDVLSDEKLADEDELKYSANSMFAASADTTVTSISQFFLAMIMYPHVLKRAQEEIDRVIGKDRLPEFSDRESLPYVDAVMSEVWRWGVPTPLNLPHCVIRDDVYRGMHIPKNSLIIVNIWAILRDECLFPDAETFNPDRFGPDVDAPLKAKRDPRNYIFGFGRRRCPGADLVESSIWIAIASMIATLDIKKAVDSDGKIIEPDVRYSNSTFRVPDRFVFDIKPRSAQALSLLA